MSLGQNACPITLFLLQRHSFDSLCLGWMQGDSINLSFALSFFDRASDDNQYFFFLVILGFEFRVSCLLGRCSPAWAMSLAWQWYWMQSQETCRTEPKMNKTIFYLVRRVKTVSATLPKAILKTLAILQTSSKALHRDKQILETTESLYWKDWKVQHWEDLVELVWTWNNTEIKSNTDSSHFFFFSEMWHFLKKGEQKDLGDHR
jgi:hypothetical protein